MYKICVFAGTTEGREVVEFLASQPVAVTACVATEYGETLLPHAEKINVSAKRLTSEEMEDLFRRESFDLVLDATHPYASVVTENIAESCAATKTEYLRLLRDDAGDKNQGVYVEDIAGAVDYLSGTEGPILLTTGSKELARFTALPDFADRVYARVLPHGGFPAALPGGGIAALPHSGHAGTFFQGTEYRHAERPGGQISGDEILRKSRWI